MSLAVIFHELAEIELNEASRFYEAEVEGLGQAFLIELENAIDRIRRNPEAAPIVLKIVRRKILRRFPYSIMYSLGKTAVFILAIASQNRRPFYWRGRL